jgi:hypothetical protein
MAIADPCRPQGLVRNTNEPWGPTRRRSRTDTVEDFDQPLVISKNLDKVRDRSSSWTDSSRFDTTCQSTARGFVSTPGPFGESLPDLSEPVVKPQLDKAAMFKALNDLRRLPKKWDGYDAEPINKQIIEVAEELVLSLPSDIVPTPKVVPMTRGRLQFEWHRGSRSLELEFETPAIIHYLKWDTDASIEEEDAFSVTDIAKVLGLLHWFASE